MRGRQKLINDITSLVWVQGAETITIKLSAAAAAGLALDLDWCLKSTDPAKDYGAMSVRGALDEPR